MAQRLERYVSRSKWADYHRRRRQQQESRPAPDLDAFAFAGDQGVAVTFTPERTGHLLSVFQNNGKLVTTRVGPSHPLPPLPRPAPRKLSRVAKRAQALLDARPTPDELLLQRFKAGSLSKKREPDRPVMPPESKRRRVDSKDSKDVGSTGR
ncbi:hypothetical protein DFH06DRAFT_1327896 [Mycena polygramma]|nr:hypothetical protein DFH06DRAFT_1327896 [Mycena polygramma]